MVAGAKAIVWIKSELAIHPHRLVNYADFVNSLTRALAPSVSRPLTYEQPPQQLWIAEALKLLSAQEIYWIDDEAVPVDGVQAIRVNPKGEHELIAVQAQPDQLLALYDET